MILFSDIDLVVAALDHEVDKLSECRHINVRGFFVMESFEEELDRSSRCFFILVPWEQDHQQILYSCLLWFELAHMIR